MKTLLQRAAFIVLVLLTAGCAAMKERPKVMNLNPHRNALVQKYSKDDSWYQKYQDAVAANELTKAQLIRDEVLYDLIWLVDDRYTDFENSLNADSALMDTTSTITSVGSTTAATITRAPGTKNILAAVSTFVTGTNTAFNANFFQSKARTAIIAAMRSGRFEVLTRMTTGMGHHVDKYSLGEGLTDVLSYYDAGTVVAALNTIQDNAKQQKDNAQDKATQKFAAR
jgi:hypothetical protein